MEDPRWLRLMTIGLILAALAVGYFLFSGRLSSNSVKTGSQTNVSSGTVASAIPAPSVLGQNAQGTVNKSSTPSASPASAYNRIAGRTQTQVTTLPKTGFPEVVAGVFSIGIMIAGWGLRRFPK